MRLSHLAFALLLALAIPASAEDRNPVIEGVIQSQIDAFLADDFETAFTYASPMIQRGFGSSERFGQMVRQGYPMVWRPSDVRYLDVETRGPFDYQKVLITDDKGVPHVLEYQMIEDDGGYQINGVRILRAEALGA
ncbi:MAG: DUF4864 domain-containing protein [Pseudomonadota bacterium]